MELLEQTHDLVKMKILAELVTEYGAYLLKERKAIGRASTLIKYLTMATSSCPQVMTTTTVQRFLQGVQHLAPIMQGLERLPRDLPEDRLERLLEEMFVENEFVQLMAVAGLMAGLRLDETIRIMNSRRSKIEVSVDGKVRFAESADLKTTGRGQRFSWERTTWISPECARTLRRVLLWPLGWTERRCADLRGQVTQRLVAAGLPTDVRAFRRVMAVRVAARARRGRTEEEAVALARQALGHRPGGSAVFRYLGRPGTAAQQQELESMQRTVWNRSAGGRRE